MGYEVVRRSWREPCGSVLPTPSGRCPFAGLIAPEPACKAERARARLEKDGLAGGSRPSECGAMGPRQITEAPAMQCLFNASMGEEFPKCSQSPAERRAPLLSQTETANPRGNVDTENPNETLYVYHPRRGSLWFIPTLGHCNHRIRGPDIPPRGHQRTLSRYPHWNYWSGN